MELPVAKRRSARQLAGRKRSIYYESDTEDEGVELLTDEYDQDDSPVDPAPPPSRPPQPQRSRKKSKRSHKPITRSKKQRAQTSERPKRWQKGWSRPLGTFPKKQREDKAANSAIPSDGVRPAWTSLPIEILREIFIFASQPLHEQSATGSANVTWLIKAAYQTSPALAEPALEAYYHSPAIHSVVQPHHLLELMQLPADQTYIKYRPKVKRLEINVKHLTYSAQGRPPFNLGLLVRELPQLQHMEVINPMDKPPYRPLQLPKWHYPPNLFDAMDDANIRLRTWRWSRDMMHSATPEDLYRDMTRVHSSRSFQNLNRLVLCGFDFNDSAVPLPTQETGENSTPPNLTSAISALPNLRDVTFTSCDLIMDDFLLRLPKTLERLELTNCLEITADMLQTYLSANGSHLRELVLNSNAALNLAFLPCLKTACPQLQTLTMDTTYYSERTNYNDAYAFYDQLLTPAEHPTWPSTLRHLELANLQKWGADAASVLFQSLIDHAPELSDLRHLAIQAHIDIAWRDRAEFRDSWVDKLRAVFLQQTPPPLAYLSSLKTFREWKDEQPLPFQPSARDEPSDSTHRLLSHVRITPRKPPADHHLASSGSESESEAEAAPQTNTRAQTSARPRRSARVAETQSAASLSATPAPDTPGTAENDGDEQGTNTFVQGLCKVVDLRIDNQRPRETQYTEANFIDSEVSGDEDWHEGAELSDDGYVR